MRTHCFGRERAEPRGEAVQKFIKRAAIVAGILIGVPVLFVGVNLALISDGAVVSHWKSEEARERFERVYDETLALMPEPVATEDVATDFGTVRAYRFEKPGADDAYRALDPLVLLPGHSAPTPMWQGTVAELMQGRPVISIDLLGQPGLSVPTRPVADAADQAAWLDQTLEGLSVGRAHLVGLSFGGWTAMNLTARHPERVASVSLFDPVLVFAPLSPEVVVFATLSAFPLMPPGYTDWFTRWTANGSEAGAGSPEARIISAGLDDYRVVQPTPQQLTAEQVRGIEAPVQAFIAGESVMHDGAAAARTAEDLLVDGEVVLKPEASHAIHGEYAGELNARILAFAAQHE